MKSKNILFHVFAFLQIIFLGGILLGIISSLGIFKNSAVIFVIGFVVSLYIVEYLIFSR